MMKKRSFLVLLLTLCFVPFGVNAESKIVNNENELLTSLADTKITEIVLGQDIETNGKVNIVRDVTIDGAGHTIRYTGEFFATSDGVGSSDSTIWSKKSSNGIAGAVYILQAYRCNVTIKDIALTGGNRALGINGATVTLNGAINVTGNGFHPIELSNGAGVTEVSTLKIDDETIILNGSENIDDANKDATLFVDDKDALVVKTKDGKESSETYTIGTKKTFEELNINLLYIVDDGESKNVPSDLFDFVKSNDQILSLAKLNDKDELVYTWEFDGKDIVDPTIEVNTSITFTEEAPLEVRDDISKVVTNYQELSYLNFEHNGKLPGKAVVSYYVLDKYAVGTKLYVAHFNETTKKLENVQEVVVDEDGSISFDVSECSSYALYTSITDDATSTNPPVVENAETGDIHLYMILSLVLVALAGLLITSKKILLKVK